MKGNAIRWSLLAAISVFLVPCVALGASPTVLTVPWVPSNPTVPHTTYPVTGSTEAKIIMGATVPSAVGSGDSFTVTWHFADGSADVTFPLTNPYDISTTHQFPAAAAVGTIWIATVTVRDTTNSTSTTANYYVIQESNDCTKLNPQKQPVCVASRVNVAIDWGLWYMHQTMWRVNANANGPGNPPVNWGGWDLQSVACPTVNGQAVDCANVGVIDASNVQAFEVNGHLPNGPAADPYTDDVARGLARAENFIGQESVATDTYTYNPATENYICADHSVPQTTDSGACTGHGGRHLYNASAASCTSPPCTVTYDGNANGKMAFSNDGSGNPIYTSSPFMEALIATGTPNALVQTGPYAGTKFSTVVQDFMDFYGFAQYGSDCDVDTGFTRGNGSSCNGSAWLYQPQQGDDDSTSQWAAIGFISGNRGFGLGIPKAITDFNDVWVTNAQDLTDPAPVGTDPFASSDNLGAYGYRGSFAFSDAWGPFAVTPSAMVQMALDGVGRTANTTFGGASTDFDQRWNTTETFYADNFCNDPANGAFSSPRDYMYGMFSFTKSMLLHNQGGTLAPIQYLRTLTPNVFTGNPNVPANTIDWYAALSAASGGKDACDGIAQTLINFQMNPVSGIFDGHWYGNTYYVCYQGGCQSAFETSWALIMLKGTVFVACVNNLSGRGASGIGTMPPRIDLTWTNQANATKYVVSRSSTNGGPYTEVGTTTTTAFEDKTAGLINGDTYYYVVFPEISGTEVCQSNQATVKVPASR